MVLYIGGLKSEVSPFVCVHTCMYEFIYESVQTIMIL